MPTPRAVPEDGIVAEQAARPLFQAVADEVREYLDGDASGHDLDHAWRVFALGMRIAEAEGADREVVGAAALVHDLHRTMCEPGEYVHPEETVDEVRAILERAGFPAEKIPEVCHAVAVHDEYDYRGDPDRTESLEAEILQDADNLDVARTPRVLAANETLRVSSTPSARSGSPTTSRSRPWQATRCGTPRARSRRASDTPTTSW